MGKKLISMLLVLAIGITLLSGVAVLTSATEPTALDGATTMSAWAEGGYADLTTKVLTINNTDDFAAFQTALAEKNKTFEGYTIYLTADIDMNPHWNSRVNLEWDDDKKLLTADDGVYQNSTGVGEDGYVLPATNSAGKIFNGTFDGQGHSISGLYLSQNAANAASLFGKTTGTAEVKNLAVLDSYFQNGNGTTATTTQASIRPLAGLFTIIESGASATISNCYVDVDLYDRELMFTSSATFYAKLGGLVGYCLGNLTVENSVYAGSISQDTNTEVTHSNTTKESKQKHGAGGVVGLVQGDDGATAKVTVNNFVYAGQIWIEDEIVSGGVGYANKYTDIQMTNCLNLGRLSAAKSISGFVGRIRIHATYKQNVILNDCFTLTNDTANLVIRNDVIKDASTIVVKRNGETVYDFATDTSTTALAGINPDSCRVYFGAASGVYSFGKGVNSKLSETPIGGNNGNLSDVFTECEGTIVPTKLYELFKADAPAISTDPVGAAYDKEVTAAALTVEATGDGTLSYQWYCNGEAIEGATEATYTPATATSGNYVYTCEVTVTRTGMLGFAASAVSEAATVHVHDWTAGTCTSPKTCNVADCPTTVDAVDHDFDDDCTTADKCANCDEVAQANEKHTFDTDCTTADKCANCETKATANEAHTYTDDHDTDCNTEGCTVTRDAIHTEGTVWSSDATGHWHVCTGCEHTFTVVAHTDSESDEDVLCDECGYDMSCDHAERTKIEGTAATCTQDGKITHWQCNKCGKLLDAEVDGNVISETATVIPAWHTGVSKKYSSDDTNHWKVCSACKEKLYVAAHTYSSATDTTCDCGHKRELVSLDDVITVTQWIEGGKAADVKAVKITNVADFKAFMKELVEGTTAVLNSSYAIRTEGNVAFDSMTIYLTADLDLNEGWTNDFNLKWDSTGKLTGNTTVTAPTNKYNPSGQRIFGGMFDGQGHTISGLFIDKQKNAAAQSFLGVAHANSDFTVGVQNLTVKNSYIEGTNPGMGAFFTGVTAGTNVVISNCSVDVDLVSRYEGKDKTSNYVGGLIGAAAGNVTIDSTTYSGSIWAENASNLDYREVGGAIGIVKGGTKADAETNVMLNDFTFNGKIYWLNGQRIGLFVGRIENQTTVSMVDSISKGKLVVMAGGYAGGLCNNIVATTAGTTTNVVIDNCYYVPGHVFSEGVLEEQSLIFNAIHSGASAAPYGGFGKVSANTTAKGTCVVYVVSDRGTDWSENLCLYQSLPNAGTGDVAGMSLGFMIAMMLFSAMALVILLPRKFCRK